MPGLVHHGLDLFNYDQQVSSNQVLITAENARSNVEYDEYVVYKRPEDSSPGSSALDIADDEAHVAHHFTRDDEDGAFLLDLAFRHGYKLDRYGQFRPPAENEDTSAGMEGRIRRVICFKRKIGLEGMKDILSMTPADVAALRLHPATLQYSTRVTTESRFWSKDRSQLSVILSFSEMPKTPCDFLSMTYNVNTRNATILVRQSWEPRRHNLDDLDEYDHRLEACRAHWAHPLIMPVVLLQVQFMRCEEAVLDNNLNVAALEQDVSNIAGFDADPTQKRMRKQRTNSSGSGGKIVWGPMTMTNLMKRAHEVLKDTIKLLDTIRWMERAVKVLILAGDELAECMGNPTSSYGPDLSMLSPIIFDSAGGPPPVSPVLPPTVPKIKLPDEDGDGDGDGDTLASHWHEIRQYLDGLLRLCMGLETDRRMSEARCRAQIDMIYSKMAQEDNILNARMAVSSSRDSSSMKALAVITAIFLPAEVLASIFGMSMFDWLGPDSEDDSGGSGSPEGNKKPGSHFGENFWVYWAVAIPVTLFIFCLWRAWWVTQDRYFRRHLSQELSEERFWTVDGKPRVLDDSFIHDFFYLSARREEKQRVDDELAELETINSGAKMSIDGVPRGAAIRQRQIMAARQWSMKQRATAVSV